jgi:hypothetical protein
VTGRAARRLQDAGTLPDVLVAAFGAFEFIRETARACEDGAPELLATFMTVADRAVDGRDAIMAAPSLSLLPGSRWPQEPAAADADAGWASAALAALGVLLARKLAWAAEAAPAGDRESCLCAARAARAIHDLTKGGESWPAS